MEKNRESIIRSHLPKTNINDLSLNVRSERASVKTIVNNMYALNSELTPDNIAFLKDHDQTASNKMLNSVESDINNINFEYFFALDKGVEPEEAKLRKKLRQDRLSLRILLARRSDGHGYFPGVEVKLYDFETDGGISVVARNRIDIIIPNSEDPIRPHVLKTRVNNLLSILRRSSLNTKYDALDFNKEVLKPQVVERVRETEDDFISRRLLEIQTLNRIIQDTRNSHSVDLSEFLRLRQTMISHLVTIWASRKSSQDNNHAVKLSLGYVFGQNNEDDMLEMTTEKDSATNSINFALVSRWPRNRGVTDLIHDMEKNGVRSPSDYDFIR